jgi:hypothetical protein
VRGYTIPALLRAHVDAGRRLDTDTQLKRFQSGLLASELEEWHCIVPAEAQNALDKREVQRQSVIFELLRAERDYVQDLVLVKEV